MPRGSKEAPAKGSPDVDRVPLWALLVGGLAVLLFIGAAIVWAVDGGLDGTEGQDEWVSALGTEDGTARIVVIAVGEATLVASLLYILLLTAQGPKEERHLVRASTAGALLLAVEGALLASIGWVAVPHIGAANMTPSHPFVQTVELLMALRMHVSLAGGSLIGIGAAWAALRAYREDAIPRWLLVTGAGAGVVAVLGGALLVLGFGAAVHTVGVIGSIAWTGTRSGFLTYRAARGQT